MIAEPLTRRKAMEAREHFRAVIQEATHDGRPVIIAPRDEPVEAVVLSRPVVKQMLSKYPFHTRVIPEEEDGGYTLWIDELALGEYGDTILAARDALLVSVRSSTTHFFNHWDVYRHRPDQQARYFHYLRVALADDAELKRILFTPSQPVPVAEPTREPAGVA